MNDIFTAVVQDDASVKENLATPIALQKQTSSASNNVAQSSSKEFS